MSTPDMYALVQSVIDANATSLFEVDAERFQFLHHPVWYQLLHTRGAGDVDEIQSLVLASMFNWHPEQSPVGVYEGGQLCFGSEVNAMDHEKLRELGITHVLNVAGAFSGDFRTSKEFPHYLEVTVADNEDACLPLETCLHFLEEAMESRGNVFVHCIEGKSRSGAIIIAALLRRHPSWSYEDALEHVREQRKAVPNAGFERQLREFAAQRHTTTTAPLSSSWRVEYEGASGAWTKVACPSERSARRYASILTRGNEETNVFVYESPPSSPIPAKSRMSDEQRRAVILRWHSEYA